MQKLLIATLATLVFGAFGSVFAQQDSVDHDVRITIPEVVMIRVVTDDEQPAFVAFDYAAAAHQATYFAVLESAAGSGPLPATDTNLEDVQVLAIGTTWEVLVTTSGTFTTTGFELADVQVTPSAGDAFVAYTLATGTAIANGVATNWIGLGISGDDFALFVDGLESDGDDTITVTYTIYDL